MVDGDQFRKGHKERCMQRGKTRAVMQGADCLPIVFVIGSGLERKGVGHMQRGDDEKWPCKLFA